MTEASLTIAWLVIGLVAAGAFVAYSKSFGRSRRRALASALVIAALVYVGFAILGDQPAWILHESIGVAIFGLFSWLGIRRSPNWLAAGWALHPAWDTLLHLQGPGATIAPTWYVVACISFDILVAVFIVVKRHEL